MGLVIGLVVALLVVGGGAGAWFGGLIGGKGASDGTSGTHEVGSPAYLCEKGEKLLKDGKFDEALNYAEEAARKDPTFAPAFRLEGNAQLGRQDPRKASRAFKSYLKLAPTASDADEIKAKLAALGG